MSLRQLVQPRTNTTDGAGWCHRMARAVFGAPLVAGLDSATKAANATKFRHATREMPSVAVPVWFDHWGVYDNSGVSKNWGHVVAWVPGRGFLSSPHSGVGQVWYQTIEQVERAFGAKYRFWSEDINTLRVAAPAPKKNVTPVVGQEEEDEMKAIYYMNGNVYMVLVFDSRSGFASEYNTPDSKYNGAVASGLGTGSFAKVTKSHFEAIKRDLAKVRATA